MQERHVVRRVVGDDAVVVVRVARRGIERFVATLRAADEVEPLRRAAVGLPDDRHRHVVALLDRLLSEVPERFIVERERAIETLCGLVPAIGAQCDEPLLQRVGHVRRLQREAGQAGDQRAVVAAAAHLQRAAIP